MSKRDPRQLHQQVAHYKTLLETANIEFNRVGNLEFVECEYTLSYLSYQTDRPQTIRINAPVDQVRNAMQQDIDKLEDLLENARTEYAEWANE